MDDAWLAYSALGILADRTREALWSAHRRAEIGAQLALRGHDAVSLRSVVPARRKLSLIARVFGAWWLRTPELEAPVAEQARILVDAVEQQAATAEPRTGGSSGRFSERMVWTLELFSALEARDRAQLAARGSWSSTTSSATSCPRSAMN